jgi:sugar lactone lactonase YvrE
MRNSARIRRDVTARYFIAIAVLLAGSAAYTASVMPVATFAPPAYPESIAFDKVGNMYLAMFPTGEIRKISPDGTQSSFAVLGSGSTVFPGRRLAGLAVDAPGNVYAALNDIPATRGIWRVARDGTPTLIAAFPSAGLLNALTFDPKGNLYVSDTLAGKIYKVDRSGSITDWSADPLLHGVNPTSCGTFPAGPAGANGISFNKHGDMFVANTTVGAIVHIPIANDGTAGIANDFAGPTCDLWGVDGTAFDNEDNLYVTVNIQRKIVRIDPNGTVETLAAGPPDPLYAPTALAFATGRGERKQLFISNGAYPPLGGGIPGVVTLDVGVPGRPLP